MGTPMSEEKCPRCDRPLAVSNTNPDRLCAPCQRYLGKPESEKYQAWINLGKPQANAMTWILWLEASPFKPAVAPAVRRPKGAARVEGKVEDLPTQVLIACAKELKRRSVEAKQIIAAMKGV